jgi:hypothetical protein
MKRLLVLIMAMSVSGLFAQGVIEQGRWVTTGVLCYDSESDEEKNDVFTSEDSWNIGKLGVYGGYAFADNQVVGLGVGYESSVSKTMRTPVDPNFGGFYQDDTYREGTFSISPFYRYYKWCGEDFAFVGTAKLPIGFTNESFEDLNDSSDPNQGKTKTEYPSHTSFGVWIVPTFMWMPDENWSIEAGIGQLGFTTSSASGDGEEYSSFQFSGKIDLFSPMFMFSYYF